MEDLEKEQKLSESEIKENKEPNPQNQISGPENKKLRKAKVPKYLTYIIGIGLTFLILFMLFYGILSQKKAAENKKTYSKPKPQSASSYRNNQTTAEKFINAYNGKKNQSPLGGGLTGNGENNVKATIKKIKTHFNTAVAAGQSMPQVSQFEPVKKISSRQKAYISSMAVIVKQPGTGAVSPISQIINQQNNLNGAMKNIQNLSNSVPVMEKNIQKQQALQSLYKTHPNQGFIAGVQNQKQKLQKVLTPVYPVSPYEIEEGTIIPAALMTEINSQLPGFIKAEVVSNVYSYNGKYLEIPKGSFLVGMYSSQIKTGQERLLVAFRTLELPNGTQVDLMGMPGMNNKGIAGFHDLVNTHFWTMFGASLLLSFISVGSQAYGIGSGALGASAYGTAAPVSPAGVGEQTLGNTAQNLGQTMFSQYENLAPTLIIRQGYRFNVFVSKNMALKPYQN